MVFVPIFKLYIYKGMQNCVHCTFQNLCNVFFSIYIYVNLPTGATAARTKTAQIKYYTYIQISNARYRSSRHAHACAQVKQQVKSYFYCNRKQRVIIYGKYFSEQYAYIRVELFPGCSSDGWKAKRSIPSNVPHIVLVI